MINGFLDGRENMDTRFVRMLECAVSAARGVIETDLFLDVITMVNCGSL